MSRRVMNKCKGETGMREGERAKKQDREQVKEKGEESSKRERKERGERERFTPTHM